jgi:hypothetical protein
MKDEITYIVKDRKLTKLIYRLAKENFKFQSLIYKLSLLKKALFENNTKLYYGAILHYQGVILL